MLPWIRPIYDPNCCQIATPLQRAAGNETCAYANIRTAICDVSTAILAAIFKAILEANLGAILLDHILVIIVAIIAPKCNS